MEKSLKNLKVGDYVRCRRNVRKFKLYEYPVTEGVEMAKHLREVLDDMSQVYKGNHEKIMVGFAGYLAGIIKGMNYE